MRMIAISILILCTFVVFAADTAPRLNVKLGLWEVTTTTSMAGAPPIPSDALANMTPEQRAMVEQRMSMGGAPRTSTEKTCETKEKLEKDNLFKGKDDECTRTPVTNTATRVEMKMHCSVKGYTSDGTIRFDAISPENVKGAMDMTSSEKG